MTEQVMTSEEFVGDYLEHYGVKGMRWGVRKERRAAVLTERKKTREALRDVRAKGVNNKDSDILKARDAIPGARRRVDSAKDQYKIDKVNADRIQRIAAKRNLKVAAAELRRLNAQADRLTKQERFDYEMMQLGRGLADAFLKGEPRSATQKMFDSAVDKEAVKRRTATARR